MRRLLNTLFILTEDTYLALENENVVVKREDDILGTVFTFGTYYSWRFGRVPGIFVEVRKYII